MNTDRKNEKIRVYEQMVADWKDCTHYGYITSNVKRTNDVPEQLIKLGVEYLKDFLLINHTTNAFVYSADLGQKYLTDIIEIYYDMVPRTVEWRKQGSQLALKLDDDLYNGFYYENVIITEFVIAHLQTAIEEVLIYT